MLSSGYMPPSLIRVVAVVVSRGDHLLVCRRSYERRHGGLWEFPGGKSESGESVCATAKRELQEELGVEVIDVGEEEFAIRDPDSSFLIVFAPARIIGEPKCGEHLELRWAKPTELTLLPLAPSDRRYIEFRLSSPRLDSLSKR